MDGAKKGLPLKLLVVFTFTAMVAVNALANILPINGIGTGAVSDSFPNLFAPVGLTFSIWGLIYILLAVHTLYQLGLFRKKGGKGSDALLNRTGIVFALSSLVNSIWIFSWHYKLILLSMVLMLLLLICLIVIVRTINAQSLTLREKFLVRLPFSIYFGWITVATIANATTLLVSIGWDGSGLAGSVWTDIVLAAGLLIGVAAMVRFRDVAYGLTLIWAYAGILIKHTAASGFSNQYPDVILTVSICLAILTVTAVYVLSLNRRRSPVRS